MAEKSIYKKLVCSTCSYKKIDRTGRAKGECPHGHGWMRRTDEWFTKIWKGKTAKEHSSLKKSDLEDLHAAARQARRQGLPLPGEEKQIAWKDAQESFEKWMEGQVRDDKMKRSTIDRMYAIALIHLQPVFKDKTLQAITVTDVRDFMDRRREAGLSKSSVNHDLGTLKRIYSLYCQWHSAREYPLLHAVGEDIRKIKPLENKNYKDRVVSDAEEAKWLEICTSERFRMFWIIGIETALRSGNILDLEWSKHIDMKERWIFLTAEEQKGVKDIHIPISDRLFEELTAWRKKHPFTKHVIFSRYNKLAGITRISKVFKIISTAAGMPDITAHTLRHTCATRWLEDGVPLEAVSKLLGHADISITARRYEHVRKDYLRAEMEKVNASRRLKKAAGDTQ